VCYLFGLELFLDTFPLPKSREGLSIFAMLKVEKDSLGNTFWCPVTERVANAKIRLSKGIDLLFPEGKTVLAWILAGKAPVWCLRKTAK